MRCATLLAFDIPLPGDDEAATLARVQAKVFLIGISSDWLFPPQDVRALGERMRSAGVDARYAELTSSHGHDGFLADAADMAALVAEALEE